MLKVLRVVSWFAVVLAVVGVTVLGLLLTCGEGEILDFLRRPGVVQRRQGECSYEAQDRPYHRLELAAASLGQRLKPPLITSEPAVETKTNETAIRIRHEKKEEVTIPKSPIFQYQLVGTFVAEGASARSMALIEVSKGRFEWVEPGQFIGRHRLGDITPRRTTLIDGAKRTELVMSPKPPIGLPVSGWIVE